MNLSNNTYSLSEGRSKIAGGAGSWLVPTLARLGHLAAAWAARRARNRDLRELYRFSDRELWDVGLSRSDILAIARGTYSRD
jgi:uncharacterized protein YjiS (DUF1127 family)